MPNSLSLRPLTRRRFTQLSGMAVGSLASEVRIEDRVYREAMMAFNYA
jgi:hypothetical protein